MLRGKKIILTICARGGSKGLPGKNVRTLLGMPLIVHTIRQAKMVKWIDRIVVSTDSEEIRNRAVEEGIEVPFLRSKKLAGDRVSKIPVFIDAIEKAEKYWKDSYDIWVDLDVTSPLRSVEDTKNAIKMLFKANTLAVITATPARRNPYFNMIEVSKSGYVQLSKKAPSRILRRQDAPKVYDMNGSIYVMWKDELIKRKTFFTEKTRLYVMPVERSHDIDSELDFKIVEMILSSKRRI